MLIGQISKLSGLSRDTIRFYEKKELIKVEVSDTPFNNYKNYTRETLQRLLLIKQAKSFGFTLNEIAKLLVSVDENTATCSFFYEKVKTKIISIDEEIQILLETKNRILQNLKLAENNCSLQLPEENCSQIYLVK